MPCWTLSTTVFLRKLKAALTPWTIRPAPVKPSSDESRPPDLPAVSPASRPMRLRPSSAALVSAETLTRSCAAVMLMVCASTPLAALALDRAGHVQMDQRPITPDEWMLAEPVRRDAAMLCQFDVGKPVRDDPTNRR